MWYLLYLDFFLHFFLRLKIENPNIYSIRQRSFNGCIRIVKVPLRLSHIRKFFYSRCIRNTNKASSDCSLNASFSYFCVAGSFSISRRKPDKTQWIAFSDSDTGLLKSKQSINFKTDDLSIRLPSGLSSFWI